MTTSISRTMVGEYVRFLAEAKDDHAAAAELFRAEAELASAVAIDGTMAAEATRRASDTVGLVDAGLGVAGAFVDDEESDAAGVLSLAQAGTAAAQTGLDMVHEDRRRRIGEFTSAANESLSIASQVRDQEGKLDAELRTLGSTVRTKA